jgi:cold shock CspA family protein
LTRTGTVIAFDDPAGLGIVRDEAGGEEFGFHCTQIADGTRTIAIGTAVRFTVAPGHRGQWEAQGLTPAG